MNLMIIGYKLFLNSSTFIVIFALWINSLVMTVKDENTSAIFNSALDYVRQENYPQALVYFTKVIERNDSLAGAAYSNRCLANLQLQHYVAAETDCTVAVRYNSNNVEGYLNLGLALHLEGKHRQAITQYQQVIQLDRHDYRAYYNRGLAHFALADHPQAIVDYNLALMSPRPITAAQKALIYNNRSLVYMVLKNYQRAIADLDRAIALESHNYNAYFDRGCVHYRQGNYSAAIEDFDRVVRLEPNFTQAYVSRAVSHHQMGHSRAASIDIDTALQQYQKQGNHVSYDRTVALKRKLFYSQPSQIG